MAEKAPGMCPCTGTNDDESDIPIHSAAWWHLSMWVRFWRDGEMNGFILCMTGLPGGVTLCLYVFSNSIGIRIVCAYP